MESLRLQIEASLGRSRDMIAEDRYRRLQMEGGHVPHRYQQPTLKQHPLPASAIAHHHHHHHHNPPPGNPTTPGSRLKKQLHLFAKRTIGKKQGGSTKGLKYPDEVSPIYWRHPREKFGSVSALSTSAIYGELRPPPMSYAAIYGGSTGVRHSGGRRGSAAALGGVHVSSSRAVGRATASPWETFLNIGEPIYEDVAQEMIANQNQEVTSHSVSGGSPCTCGPTSRSAVGSIKGGNSGSVKSVKGQPLKTGNSVSSRNGSTGSLTSPKRKSILPEKIELYALTEERLDGEIKSPSPIPVIPVVPSRRHTPKHNRNDRANNSSANTRQHGTVSGSRRPTSLNNMGKKLEANPFSSVASRKSILECDLSAYDMVKQYLRTTEIDSEVDEDDLSDNAVDTSRENAIKKLTPRWSEERRSTGSESDAGIGGSETSLGNRHYQRGEDRSRKTGPLIKESPLGVRRGVAPDSDNGFVSVPEPDYDDEEEEDSDASYDLSKFKDLRISYSPPPVRKPSLSSPTTGPARPVIDGSYRTYTNTQPNYPSSRLSPPSTTPTFHHQYQTPSKSYASPPVSERVPVNRNTDRSSWSSKRSVDRPTIPPPPPPPPPLPVHSPSSHAPPTHAPPPIPPPLPPRSPTRVQSFGQLELKEKQSEVIPDFVNCAITSTPGLRSILKKNSSGRSDRSAKRSEVSSTGSSKQVRFGGAGKEDALVIEHIENEIWDSEEEIPAELLPPEEQLIESASHGKSSDMGFHSVSEYLSGPLRSAWNLRSAAVPGSTPSSTVGFAPAESPVKTSPARSKEDKIRKDTEFEFIEFDPAENAPKNGLPSPAVPRPINDDVPRVKLDSAELSSGFVTNQSVAISAATGQRGKVESPPKDHGGKTKQELTSIAENNQTVDVTTTESLPVEEIVKSDGDVTKHGASTFYVSINDFSTPHQSEPTPIDHNNEVVVIESRVTNNSLIHEHSEDRNNFLSPPTSLLSVPDSDRDIYSEVLDNDVTRVDIYVDGQSNDPIYEELPDVSEEEDLKKAFNCEQPRSFFEGASRAEILLYLEDARQRGVVLSEDFLLEINEIEEEAKREEEENDRNNRISTLSSSSTGSSGNSGNDDDIDDDYVIAHETQKIETIKSDFILKSLPETNEEDQDPEKISIKSEEVRNGHCNSAEVERADSGVGTETSKPSVRLRRLVAKQPSVDGQEGAQGEEQLCADCDQPVEPIEDELSWMLFSPLVCKKCDRRRSERKEIISEIVETELKFGRDLRIIKEEFQRPMEVAGLLTKEQLRAIFINLDELIRVNGQFAEKLHDATDIAIEQGDEDYTTVNIGKLFLESTTMLHAFETYCVRQGSSSLLLNNLEKEKELLRIFLRVSQMENTLLRRMNLPAFLMVPVQRVTKYPLLLSRLHKVTPYHHKDRESLREAQHKIELHLEHINQQTKGSGATRIWRRISNISSSSHRRLSNLVDDISSIKLRKMALEVLKWNRDEVRFVLAGRLLCAPVAGANRNSLTLLENGSISNGTNTSNDGGTPNSLTGSGGGVPRRGKGLKLTPLHGLLVTLGKPNANYRPETADDEDGIFFPRNTGIRDATLLLIREKNGRLTLFRGPLHLGCSVISCWEGENDAFEIQEYHTKEAYVFKCEDPKETKDWCHQLRYHAKDLGNWRRRRNALANIMINGMVRQ